MKKILITLLFSLAFNAQAKDSSYKPHCFTQPCFVEGDFDGDGLKDRAELIETADHKKGIEVKFANGGKTVIGAGNKIGQGGDDFLWMDVWSVHTGKIEKPNKKAAKPPTPKGDSLQVAQEFKSSAIIYWNGSKFAWYQLEKQP